MLIFYIFFLFMKCEWLVVWYGGFNHCSKVQTALWQQHTRYKPLPVTLPSAGPWWLSVYQIGLPTLSNKFHGRKDTKLAFRSRCVVDNLRNQIKFSFIHQSSDFIGRPFVLCDLFELSGSNTWDQMNPKNAGSPFVLPLCWQNHILLVLPIKVLRLFWFTFGDR